MGNSANTGAVLGSYGGPVGTMYGAAIGSLLGGSKRKRTYLGNKLQPPTERELWRMDRMQALMGDMSPDESVLRAIASDQKGSDRFIENTAEFYSHPGAYQSLQQAGSMFGQQAPDVYGAPWENMMREKIMSQTGQETADLTGGLTQQMASRGYYGALGQSQQGAVGQSSALARMKALLGLQGTLADQRYSQFQDQFSRDYQATGLLQSIVTGQPSAPYIQKENMSGWEKFGMITGAAGNIMGGLGSIIPG